MIYGFSCFQTQCDVLQTYSQRSPDCCKLTPLRGNLQDEWMTAISSERAACPNAPPLTANRFGSIFFYTEEYF
ncbi:MAG: hypothetical protein ACREXR_20540, partial [Gammaproteobacteria bacterium]